MLKQNHRIVRRELFKGLAGFTFASAALKFFTENAHAAAFPLRFLIVHTQNGRHDTSKCSGLGTSFSLGSAHAALEPLKKKILILDGIRIPEHASEEHPSGNAAMLTGRPSTGSGLANGISIDRYLANKLTNGASVYTGVESPSTSQVQNAPCSWEGANVANTNFIQGSEAFVSRLLNKGTPVGVIPNPSASGPTGKDKADLALYDFLMKETEKLRSYAPKSEAEKLQMHITSLTQMRAPLAQKVMPSQNPADKPIILTASCGAPDLSSPKNETDKLSLALAHSFACGAARIGVLNLDSSGDHHSVSHYGDNPTFPTVLNNIDLELSQRFAQLLKYLDAFPEGSGTLLDNTIVIWSSEVSGLHGGETHGTTNMPFVLAGALGGKIKTGVRMVQNGRTNGDLYRALIQGFGLGAGSDFGDPAIAKSPLTEILT